MKKVLFLFLLTILIFNSCKKDESNLLGPNGTAQIWHMVNDAGEIAEVVITPFTNSGTFSETDNSQHWYMSYPGGKMRIPVSGTISHTSQGDHWYFTITIQNGGVSLLGTGEGYSNGNFPDATTASGTVKGTAAAPGMGSQAVTGTWNAYRTGEVLTGEVPEIPALSSPSNNATNVSNPPTLKWNSSNGAIYYKLQISKSAMFNVYNVYDDSNLTNTSQQINTLDNFTKYYWRVRSKNASGRSSYSAIWNFTTAPGGIVATPCPGIPTVTYYGKTYNTVQIINQCWLKENLDVGIRINGSLDQTNNGTVEKYCYNDDPANCTTYGGLYLWAEAVQYKNGATNSTSPNPAFTSNVQGICPTGWHIPTKAELNTLSAAVGDDGRTLEAVGQGPGTNTSGFSGLLSGYRAVTTFYYLGITGNIWSSTDVAGIGATIMALQDDGIVNVTNLYKNNGFSIRCVKD